MKPLIAIDDAVTGVVAALDAPSGTYNVVDDAPLTRLVEIPRIAKCRGDNGIHALKCHKDQES